MTESLASCSKKKKGVDGKRHQTSPVGSWPDNPSGMGFYFRSIYYSHWRVLPELNLVIVVEIAPLILRLSPLSQ
jgi:hypothetical protein